MAGCSSATNTIKVVQILETLCERVSSLEEWIRRVDRDGELAPKLVTENDSEKYKKFLNMTLVAERGRTPHFSLPLSYTQASDQQDIVSRVVQRVLCHDGFQNNVITFGFYGTNNRSSVSAVCRFPNNSVNRLQNNNWKILHSRVGDMLIERLLETTSLFTPLMKQRVYLQLTGEPLYQLWPFAAGSTKRLKEVDHHSSVVSASVGNRESTVKSAYLKRKTSNSDPEQQLSKKPKLLTSDSKIQSHSVRSSRQDDHYSEKKSGRNQDELKNNDSQRQGCSLESICPRQPEKECSKNNSRSTGQKGYLERSKHHENSCGSDAETTIPSDFDNRTLHNPSTLEKPEDDATLFPYKTEGIGARKRKRECDDSEPVKKKEKVCDSGLRESGTRSDSQGSLEPDLHESAATSYSQRSGEPVFSIEEPNLNDTMDILSSIDELLASQQQESDEYTGLKDRKLVETDGQLSVEERKNDMPLDKPLASYQLEFEVKRFQHKLNAETEHTNVQQSRQGGVPGAQCKYGQETGRQDTTYVQTTGLTKRQKKRQRERKKKQQLRPCTPTSVPFQYHKYISKSSLLYGSMRQKFPKNFILSKVPVTEEGARLLMAEIFMHGDVGGNMNSRGIRCDCQTVGPPLQSNEVLMGTITENVKPGQSQKTEGRLLSITENDQHGNTETQVRLGTQLHNREPIGSSKEEIKPQASSCNQTDSGPSSWEASGSGSLFSGSSCTRSLKWSQHADSVSCTTPGWTVGQNLTVRTIGGASSGDSLSRNVGLHARENTEIQCASPSQQSASSLAQRTCIDSPTCKYDSNPDSERPVLHLQCFDVNASSSNDSLIPCGQRQFLPSLPTSITAEHSGGGENSTICMDSDSVQLTHSSTDLAHDFVRQRPKHEGIISGPVRSPMEIILADSKSSLSLTSESSWPSTINPTEMVLADDTPVSHSGDSSVTVSGSGEIVLVNDSPVSKCSTENQSSASTSSSCDVILVCDSPSAVLADCTTDQDSSSIMVVSETELMKTDSEQTKTSDSECVSVSASESVRISACSSTSSHSVFRNPAQQQSSSSSQVNISVPSSGLSKQNSDVQVKACPNPVSTNLGQNLNNAYHTIGCCSSRNKDSFLQVNNHRVDHPSVDGEESVSDRTLAALDLTRLVATTALGSKALGTETRALTTETGSFSTTTLKPVTYALGAETCALDTGTGALAVKMHALEVGVVSSNADPMTLRSKSCALDRADQPDYVSVEIEGPGRSAGNAASNVQAKEMDEHIQTKTRVTNPSSPTLQATVAHKDLKIPDVDQGAPKNAGERCFGNDRQRTAREQQGDGVGKERGETLDLPGFQHQVLPLLHQLLANHRQCNHFSLLKRHCRSRLITTRWKNPVSPVLGRRQRGFRSWQASSKTQPSTPALLEDHVPQNKVFNFVKATMKSTLPAELLGPPTNAALLLKNVKILVQAGRFEQLSLGQLMRGMKLKECAWLKNVTCHKERELRMAQLVWWIFTSYFFTVIKTFLYLTDTGMLRTRVLYYRKWTWLLLQSRAVRDFQRVTQSHRITEQKATEMVSKGEALGVSLIRFVPKSRCLRPIANMSSKAGPDNRSINMKLTKLFQVLRFETLLEKNLCGCSAFGVDDIHTKLRQFKEGRLQRRDSRRLYFFKSDVKQCFDTINQQKLLDIVTGILTRQGEQTYISRKYATLHVAGKVVKRRFYQDVSRSSHFTPDLKMFLSQHPAQKNLHDVVMVDQALIQHFSTASLLGVLRTHLLQNVIRMGGQYFVQGVGISQGSVLSTLIASVYLAHLESTHSLTALPDELLVRRMDDYLFITPHLTRARRLLSDITGGFPDYNCFVSVDKIMTNFSAQLEQPVSEIKPGDAFPWCGMLLDPGTLEVSVDYSRYSGLKVGDTATFDCSCKPGQALNDRLLTCLKNRCSPILFDPVINSEEKMLLNAYQAFLFVARLFHAFVLKLPVSHRAPNNPGFFFNIVKQIPFYLRNLLARKLKQLKASERFPLRIRDLQWLSEDAFLAVLHRHPGYQALKKLLRRKRLFVRRKMDAERVGLLKEVAKTGAKLNAKVIVFPQG